ncbi:MAG: formate dehydrogenase accessory sulfurtransferase FdhD [Alphaproteobacteria bacterium]|nr:MAG: formate dehydrogenase accessory sulfurtransferase FdhD [Alphaproteobacteria bacterium]
MKRPARSLAGLAVTARGARAISRALPEEVPVAVVFNGSTLAVMMATPADIADFAHGFALTEGAIESLDEIESFEIVEHEKGIEARFWIDAGRARALDARRRAMTGPVGCGLCGIDSLEEAVRPLPAVPASGLRLASGDILAAIAAMRARQPLHDQTRAVHAAGFLIPGQGLAEVREDVGRHNALDKLIGALARKRIAPSGGAFVLTSRVSVEMVQKTAMAGCPAIVAASAPTALALHLADAAGITLAALAHPGGFELFCHPERVETGETDVA